MKYIERRCILSLFLYPFFFFNCSYRKSLTLQLLFSILTCHFSVVVKMNTRWGNFLFSYMTENLKVQKRCYFSDDCDTSGEKFFKIIRSRILDTSDSDSFRINSGYSVQIYISHLTRTHVTCTFAFLDARK